MITLIEICQIIGYRLMSVTEIHERQITLNYSQHEFLNCHILTGYL